jgi:subtilisin family serine protease
VAAAQGWRVELDLPLYDPASGRTAVPAYAAHKLELRLAAPLAERIVRPEGNVARLGDAALDAALAAAGARTVEPEFSLPPAAFAPGGDDHGLSRYYIVHLEPGADLAQALALLRQAPGVESAGPIGIFPVAFTPDDSLFSKQYGFSQPSGRDSHLPEAWELATGDSSVIVAILDTGVQWSHPDLGGPPPYTGGSIWHNGVEMGGLDGVDDDGNGFVDDIRGWDFVHGVPGAGGEDLYTPDNDPSDFVGHGTRVAGIAGAIANNTSGVAGAGRGVKLMAVRVGWQYNPGGTGVVDMSFCAQGIEYARRNGARVINCSWQNGNLDGLGNAVDAAVASGVSVVVAAGNGNSTSQASNYLSTRGDCVDVAGLDTLDVRSSSSSYGTWVDVSAAGSSIVSTYSDRYTPTYNYGTGTSYAAPLVSGAVALYQSWRLAQGMGLATPRDILFRVRDTADPVDAENPSYAGMLGGGRLDVLRMLTDPPTSFAVATGGPAGGAPAFVEWPGGTAVVTSGIGRGLAARDAADGSLLPGWPVSPGVTFLADPAVFDLDFDGDLEVIAGADDGKLHAVGEDGSELFGFPRALGGALRTGPALGDLAGGPELEIVVGLESPGALAVLEASGETVPGWPVALPGPLSRRPAVYDLDGAGKAEIVVGDSDSTLHALHGDGTPLAGWPVRLGGLVRGGPALGDLDLDGWLDVVAASSDGTLHAFSRLGDPLAGWPVATGAPALGSPALADLDADGRLEVLVGQENARVSAWNHDGTPLAGWPYLAGGAVRGEPIVADVDADGALEVVFASLDGDLHVARADGSRQLTWPRRLFGQATQAATAGDPDGDARLEIAIGDNFGTLLVQDMGPNTFDAARLPWFTAGRAYLRHGATELPTIDAPGPGRGGSLALRIGPNPSRGGSRALLWRGAASGDEVRFLLVDVAGRVRGRETVAFDAAGTALWPLSDRADDGRRLPPGLYFVVAESGRERVAGRWVLLP